MINSDNYPLSPSSSPPSPSESPTPPESLSSITLPILFNYDHYNKDNQEIKYQSIVNNTLEDKTINNDKQTNLSTVFPINEMKLETDTEDMAIEDMAIEDSNDRDYSINSSDSHRRISHRPLSNVIRPYVSSDKEISYDSSHCYIFMKEHFLRVLIVIIASSLVIWNHSYLTNHYRVIYSSWNTLLSTPIFNNSFTSPLLNCKDVRYQMFQTYSIYYQLIPQLVENYQYELLDDLTYITDRVIIYHPTPSSRRRIHLSPLFHLSSLSSLPSLSSLNSQHSQPRVSPLILTASNIRPDIETKRYEITPSNLVKYLLFLLSYYIKGPLSYSNSQFHDFLHNISTFELSFRLSSFFFTDNDRVCNIYDIHLRFENFKGAHWVSTPYIKQNIYIFGSTLFHLLYQQFCSKPKISSISNLSSSYQREYRQPLLSQSSINSPAPAFDDQYYIYSSWTEWPLWSFIFPSISLYQPYIIIIGYLGLILALSFSLSLSI